MDQAIALVRPGATTADIVSVWPQAEEFGFPDEEAAFALQYGHGVGLSIWEKPIFSPAGVPRSPGDAGGGHGVRAGDLLASGRRLVAARIEEELVVTEDGCEVITKFPAEELLVAGKRYFTAGGQLPTAREAQSHRNTVRFTDEVRWAPAACTWRAPGDAGGGLPRPRRHPVSSVPTPEPGPGEVLVRVGAAGICGSDAAEYARPHLIRADQDGTRPASSSDTSSPARSPPSAPGPPAACSARR